jgi:hypothetical protein
MMWFVAKDPGALYGNPARDAEKFAIAVVTAWVGERGRVTDLSAGHEPDFRIEYADGRLGLGEVTTDKHETVEAMWAMAHRSGDPQVVDLPIGLGTWSAQLALGANIPRLRSRVASLVENVKALGLDRFTVYQHWPRGEPADTARRFGVEHLSYFPGDTEDVLYYFIPSFGGSYGGDPDVVTDWVDDLLARKSDNTQKLLDRTADERHVFLWADSATEFGPMRALTQLDRALPRRAPGVPEGITHVWAVARWGPSPGFAALWNGRNWSAVPLPSAEA